MSAFSWNIDNHGHMWFHTANSVDTVTAVDLGGCLDIGSISLTPAEAIEFAAVIRKWGQDRTIAHARRRADLVKAERTTVDVSTGSQP